MSAPKRTSIKLPRLRTKDELLKTSPELFNKLLLGEDVSSARSVAPALQAATGGGGAKSLRSVQSAGRLPSVLHRTGSRSLSAAYDTPRGFGDDPPSVDQELAGELESVKRERQQLLEAIAQVKAEAGTAGGEAQQADIRQLLKELELKKAKLNELKTEARRAEEAIGRARDDATDAQRLTPDGCLAENAYIQSLRDEIARVEDDLTEADAKNRLYYLLSERTRREHMLLDQKVRDKQESRRACAGDLGMLGEHGAATRAAREAAEKELAKTKRQVEEARGDWSRKIREHRTEVRELKKRQQKEHDKQVRATEKRLEREKAERGAQAKLKMEEEAYKLQVAALTPKLEAMEASWNRLRAISGADTPEQVVAYWQGLKSKEQRMRDLVALAERREATCKADVAELLAKRSAMFESSQAAAASAAAAAAATAAAAAADGAAAEQEQDLGAMKGRIEAAEQRMDAAQVYFNKLRSICVAAEQGTRALLHRLMVALEEVPPPAPGGSPPLAPTAGARLLSAGASSCSVGHAGPGDADGLRTSTGGGSRQGRVSREAVALPAGAGDHARAGLRASSSTRKRPTEPAAGMGAGANLALVPEDSSGASAAAAVGRTGSASGSSRGGPVSSLPLAGLHGSGGHAAAMSPAAAAAAAAAGSRPVLPSRGRNTIEDDAFFEGLPQLLEGVSARLQKLLAAGEGLDLAAIRAAAAAAATASAATAQSSGFNGSCSSAAPSTAAGTVEPTPRAAGPDDAAAAADGGGTAAAAAPADGGSGAAAAEQDAAETAAAEDAAAEASGRSTGERDEAAATAAAADADGGDSQAAAAEDSEGGSASRQQPEEAGGAGSAPPVAEGSTREAEQQPKAAATQTAPEAAGSSGATAEPAAAGSPPAAAVRTASAAASLAAAAPPPEVPAAALAVGGTMHTVIPESEQALMQGLYRRTWTGAPWLDAVSGNPLEPQLVPCMKRKKGKKKDVAGGPDLSRILGYTPPQDVPAESDSDGGLSDGDDGGGGAAGPTGDSAADREWIKMRAAKMAARHHAKQAAAAAAAAGR